MRASTNEWANGGEAAEHCDEHYAQYEKGRARSVSYGADDHYSDADAKPERDSQLPRSRHN